MNLGSITKTALTGLLLGSIAACSNAGAPATNAGPDASAATSPGSAEPTASGTSVSVTGVEYAYQGVPDGAKVGTVVTFVNEGNEVHEIVAVRRNEGVTTTIEELLEMPEAESEKLVTFLGVAVADPGQTATETITLDQPGGYIFLCFIPVGTTELPSLAPNASPDASLLPDGPPHFLQGMVAEFTVTE